MRKTTRTVAALLDLATIGVENAIAKIGVVPRGCFDQQNLVATDAEVAVSNVTDLGRGEGNFLRDAVEHHEIISLPMHLGELQPHWLSWRRVIREILEIAIGERRVFLDGIGFRNA